MELHVNTYIQSSQSFCCLKYSPSSSSLWAIVLMYSWLPHTIPVYSLVYNFWTLCIVSLSFYQWPPLSTFGQLTVPAGCSGMKLHVMQKKSSKLSLVVRSLLPVFQDQLGSQLVHLCCSFYSQQSGSASKFTLFWISAIWASMGLGTQSVERMKYPQWPVVLAPCRCMFVWL